MGQKKTLITPDTYLKLVNFETHILRQSQINKVLVESV